MGQLGETAISVIDSRFHKLPGSNFHPIMKTSRLTVNFELIDYVRA